MTVLPWLLPPAIGAAIGFVTNDIAIRMLFRPLREYRLLGVRIPFTPGIIPRRRHELAQAIGRMVSQELVTAETIGAYLEHGSAQEGLRGWVSRATSQVLEARVTDLPAGAGAARELVTELLEGFLRSDRFRTVIRAALETVLVSLETASLSSLAGDADAATAIARAVIRLLPMAGADRSPPDAAAVEATVRAARLLAAPAGRGLGRWLCAPEIRPELERRARDLLRGALDKLSTLQRLVVRAGKYDRRLEEKLPEIVDETVARLGEFLADRATQDALAEAVRAALERGGEDAGPAGAPPDGQVGEVLTELLAAWVRPILGRPIVASVQDLAGVSPQVFVDRITEQIAERARMPGTASRVLDAIRSVATRHPGGATVGEILGIPVATKARLDTLLADKALELLRSRLGDLLAGLDIRAMVVQRIDSLDVADVEKLLTMVIARHLKWINVFGAILGAVIGLAQAVLNNLF